MTERNLTRRDFLRGTFLTSGALALDRFLKAEKEPFSPRLMALYLTFESLVKNDRMSVFKEKLLSSGANAAVLDIKAGGLTHLNFEHPLKTRFRQWPESPESLANFIAWAKGKDITVIGRMVIMEDNVLLSTHPHLALHDIRGGTWLSVSEKPWANPYRHEIADYNAAVAKAAIEAGVDEVQYDYVRFPSGESAIEYIEHTKANTFENRTKAIKGILAAGKEAVSEVGGRIAVDFFGGTAWPGNGDMGIGQHIETVAPFVDAICPMAYPSLYGSLWGGIPDYCAQGSACPYDIVYLTTKLTQERLQAVNSNALVETWTQTYRDSRFGNPMTIKEFEEQQKGAIDGGASGIFAWNPSVNYPDNLFLKYAQYPTAPKTDLYSSHRKFR